MPRHFRFALGLLLAGTTFAAEPLSRSFSINFFRDVPSRNLKGLATRSDGRLIAGPVLRDLSGPALPDLLWTLEGADEGKWLVGTGPDGRIVEVTLAPSAESYTVRDVATLSEPQVLAVKRLPSGDLLAGTSPNGVLFLLRDEKVAAQVALPVDSIFDIVLRRDRAYVATGNPARIYEVDLAKLPSAGMEKERVKDPAALEAKGIRLFGEVRDRNIRRLAWLDDRLVAGSAPKGNLYAFDAAGGSPQVLQENRDAEVAALLPQENGDLYAAVVFAAKPGENRINRPDAPKTDTASGDSSSGTPAVPAERFGGRSAIVYLPKNGFPETVVARPNLAFYALARRGPVLVIAGGEQGDVLGYDMAARQSLSFAGSDSTQVNALAPILPRGAASTDEPDRFLALRNNAPGLAVIDFALEGPRSAETRRLDLGIPSELGAVRLARLRNVVPEQIQVSLRGNLGGDEIEGWSPWTETQRKADGWMAPDLRARNVKLRLSVNAPKNALVEIDDATLFYLPQNRRPQLTEFRVLPPNYALQPAPAPVPPAVTTLGQLINATDRDEKKQAALLSSQVIPQPGMQIVTWNVNDPDNDTLATTFSIKREGEEAWTDVAVGTTAGFAQFNTSHLEDGVYLTQLTAVEQDPRPQDRRLTSTFETEEFVIDHTPPTIVEAKAGREDTGQRFVVTGRDATSLLEGAQFLFNNGHRVEVSQPEDGVRDSQTETFAVSVPHPALTGATSVEITLTDAVGNRSARRLVLPNR